MILIIFALKGICREMWVACYLEIGTITFSAFTLIHISHSRIRMTDSFGVYGKRSRPADRGRLDENDAFPVNITIGPELFHALNHDIESQTFSDSGRASKKLTETFHFSRST